MSIRIDGASKKIVMPIGDTALLVIDLMDENGEPLTTPLSGVAVFAVCKKTTTRYTTVLQKPVEIVDNTVTVHIANADTEALDPGDYCWDVRVLTDPETDNESGNTVESDAVGEVHSLFALGGMPTFTLTGVAVDV